MKIIGITGGIGSGKSEVLKYLAAHYDVAAVQADKVGHLLMQKGNCCYEPVIELLGESIRQSDGELNRARIAAIVYAQEKLLTALNQIIHPAVKSYIQREIAHQKALQKTYFVIEAALLLEDHYDQICDEIWYVYADEAVRRARLRKSRGYSDEKINGIIDKQLPDAEFSRRSDVIIDNSENFENTVSQIDVRMQNYENV